MREHGELLPEESSEVRRERSIIYWALEPMEYHAVYSALVIDPGKVYVTLRVGNRLPLGSARVLEARRCPAGIAQAG